MISEMYCLFFKRSTIFKNITPINFFFFLAVSDPIRVSELPKIEGNSIRWHFVVTAQLNIKLFSKYSHV